MAGSGSAFWGAAERRLPVRAAGGQVSCSRAGAQPRCLASVSPRTTAVVCSLWPGPRLLVGLLAAGTRAPWKAPGAPGRLRQRSCLGLEVHGCPRRAQRVAFPVAALTQVEVVRSFTAKQPDELSLQVADVVLIYQRVGDGEWPSLAQECVARLPGAASRAPASPWQHGCLECSGT